ncbi:MAG: DNA-directed RNA polymerase subunit alpha [Candidatus Shikimatogenerans bostrichidophilus]|nr:MAG: DNA-directed RNA polymerase subunit alpha [Candidatus Shikimatogenerans bostrichidophilus]
MDIKILILKDTLKKGIYKIYPIYNGYGITIGNSLRRILLSSLDGYTISYFKIKGILHEYTVIKGIIEDVSEIILNLKKIKFKLKNENVDIKKEEVKINIKNNKRKIYAGDFEKFTKNFKIINKKMVVCNKDESAKFNIKLIIEKGKGYIPSENKKKYKNFIPIDSIYTPIKNVSFKSYSENYMEILYLNILTDGTITPIKALIKASKILIKTFGYFLKKENFYIYKKKKSIKQDDIDYLKMRKILNTKLELENLKARTINCLKTSKIYKWKDIVKLNKKDLLKIKNFGKKSLKELIEKMYKNKLNFGMDIKKYKKKKEDET